MAFLFSLKTHFESIFFFNNTINGISKRQLEIVVEAIKEEKFPIGKVEKSPSRGRDK